MIRERIRDYRIMRSLGSGGMAETYAAVHEHSGRKAAIKIPLSVHGAYPELDRRFLHEGRVLSQLSMHPGIVKIYDWGQLPAGRFFLIMEYVEGQSLADLIRAQQRVPILNSVQIIRQLAESCDFAHRNQIVHRDLKPRNVILLPDASALGGLRPKLIDFGIARSLVHQPVDGFQTDPRTLIGTPSYMSPEQCRGAADVGSPSDVYSLGIVYYEMLSGSPPFSSDERVATLSAHLFAEEPPIRKRNSAVPERLAEFLHSMLAKEPTERPTMAEVVAQMDAFLKPGVLPEPAAEQAMLEAQALPEGAHPARTSPLTPAKRAMTAIAFLLLLGLLALLLFEYLRKQ